jgi:hypothetical protein
MRREEYSSGTCTHSGLQTRRGAPLLRPLGLLRCGIAAQLQTVLLQGLCLLLERESPMRESQQLVVRIESSEEFLAGVQEIHLLLWSCQVVQQPWHLTQHQKSMKRMNYSAQGYLSATQTHLQAVHQNFSTCIVQTLNLTNVAGNPGLQPLCWRSQCEVSR